MAVLREGATDTDPRLAAAALLPKAMLPPAATDTDGLLCGMLVAAAAASPTTLVLLAVLNPKREGAADTERVELLSLESTALGSAE